ncbi:TetR/AcrR family transcriptional regulator [Microbacterium sp. AZCO]|uniref:TetR/AcrR family transcriptional regulator n=1 Tax=Microbacterium sp. AZCO TaxID=3142976 RepID=UPI0031F38022
MSDTVIDRRRARGDASRRVILERATDLASVEGLDGLTIGRLAESAGMSKSSIATLFRGKEGLQLAAVDAAAQIFRENVVEPARTHPRGVARLAVLLRSALDYSRRRVFTGGCFFAATAADMDSKPGPVRDAVRAWLRDWYGYLEAQVRHASEAGEITADAATVRRLAFELIALDNEANARSLLTGDDAVYDIAATSMRERLIAVGANADDLAPLAVAVSEPVEEPGSIRG